MKVGAFEAIDLIGLDALVLMDEYVISEGDLATISLSSCWGLVAHNAERRRGLVGHFIEGYKLFSEAIQDVLALGNIKDTTVWVGGASHVTSASWGTSAESINRDIYRDRRFVLEELAVLEKAGLAREDLLIDWGGLETSTDARLYTSDCALVLASSSAD